MPLLYTQFKARVQETLEARVHHVGSIEATAEPLIASAAPADPEEPALGMTPALCARVYGLVGARFVPLPMKLNHQF